MQRNAQMAITIAFDPDIVTRSRSLVDGRDALRWTTADLRHIAPRIAVHAELRP